MPIRLVSFLVAAILGSIASAQPERAYFPPPGEWEMRKPSELGMDDARIAEAVAWALTQETSMPRDFSTQAEIFGRPLGPVPNTRATTNGIILCRGYIIAEWGDTAAVDPSYSIAKSYLSTILGLTIDRGMIPDIDDPVGALVRDGGYDSPHNARVTWAQHAAQTSEWEGELFGKSHTFIGRDEFGSGERRPRELREPGTFYEYNDVRINRFSLSLLRLWGRPLPDVLRTEIMDPIGASDTWAWHAYDNAMVDVDGQPMPSVGGGTRWGGGLWMSTRDHARFALLILRGGVWGSDLAEPEPMEPDDGQPAPGAADDPASPAEDPPGLRRIVSEAWIREATSQQGASPGYGYLWWLNTEPSGDAGAKPSRWPAAPRSSFAALGAGNNSIWIDPEHELVVVWRWHRGGDAQAELYRRVLEAAGE